MVSVSVFTKACESLIMKFEPYLEVAVENAITVRITSHTVTY